MLNFRTELTPLKANRQIDLKHAVLTVGSCFADTIGERLHENKFKVLTNPFGTAYNPHSIHTLLNNAVHNQLPPEHTFFTNNEIHLNYQFHSALSALTKTVLEKQVKELTQHVHIFLKDAQWLFITYGTAWIYTRNDTGEVVSNCHKMPASLFTKALLTQKKILDSFAECYTKLKAINNNINIILTVSPVRHLKETLELNSVSKSVLRLACHTLAEQYKDVYYFPAYELLLDDLRDYRFYKGDLIHPSDEAVHYIWDKFSATWFTPNTLLFLEAWTKIRSALNHKAFHPTTQAHQAFLKNLLNQLEELQKQVSVKQEIDFVKKQLK